MADLIAQHDQYLAMAKESLKKERTFIVFTFPSEGSEGEEPGIYVSAHSKEVEWAIDRLLESLVVGEVQAEIDRRVRFFRKFLDEHGIEPDPE